MSFKITNQNKKDILIIFNKFRKKSIKIREIKE
jgi:hypothetical protein